MFNIQNQNIAVCLRNMQMDKINSRKTKSSPHEATPDIPLTSQE